MRKRRPRWRRWTCTPRAGLAGRCSSRWLELSTPVHRYLVISGAERGEKDLSGPRLAGQGSLGLVCCALLPAIATLVRVALARADGSYLKLFVGTPRPILSFEMTGDQPSRRADPARSSRGDRWLVPELLDPGASQVQARCCRTERHMFFRAFGACLRRS